MAAGTRRALTFWRRSIQARVVVSTLVLSAVVISAVGWLLVQQTRDGLLHHRVDAVVAQASETAQENQTTLDSALGTANNHTDQLKQVADAIIGRGETRGFSVIVSGASADGLTLAQGGADHTAGLDLAASVPADMQARFEQIGAAPAWTYTTISTRNGDTVTSEPGIVVASQFKLPADGSTHTLYLLFPLNEQSETLGLVERALLTAAALLLVLVAGITWLVTRQVVTPVRLARRVAERLAAGQLQERLRVTGEDDLARLAMSFNQMASNLQNQIRQLEELSSVQRRFASDVSHELRTPLTTVRMASDMLYDARRRFDPAASRAAELLQTELDRFETLLVDLLEISRIDAGVAHLELEDVDLGVLVHRVVDSTQVLAERRGVRVAVVEPEHPCVAEVDSRRVERIVRNLVTNAIDHADVGGVDSGVPGVVVTVGADDVAAAVAVRDHGVGLQPGESAMVFNRFWRADPARARSSGGTGLGLSIALEDTRLHGGWLQAWGRPGDGAQFRLTLPRRAGESLRRSPLSLEPADAGRRDSGPASPHDVSPHDPDSPDSPDSVTGADGAGPGDQVGSPAREARR